MSSLPLRCTYFQGPCNVELASPLLFRSQYVLSGNSKVLNNNNKKLKFQKQNLKVFIFYQSSDLKYNY